MPEPINKQTYLGIVKFTLESMLELSKEDSTYSLPLDLAQYYNSTIKPEMIITEEEFWNLWSEVTALDEASVEGKEQDQGKIQDEMSVYYSESIKESLDKCREEGYRF